MTVELSNIVKELDGKYKKKLGDLNIYEMIEEMIRQCDKENKKGTLLVNYLKIIGKKHDNTKINFEHKFEKGVNIIIADNFKGKSSIFKIIKSTLIGEFSKKKIKNDIYECLEIVVLGFKINDNDFTINVNLKNKFLVSAYKVDYIDYLKDDNIDNKKLFETKTKSIYKEKMAELFFDEFSYYSMKWTSKSASKTSNDLTERNLTWAAYFKSIYLQSQDSLDYGNQEEMMIQMLLNFEYTQLLNLLKIKKELLEHDLIDYNCKNKQLKLDEIKEEIKSIELQLDEVDRYDSNEKISKLMENKLSLEIKITNEYEAIEKRAKLTHELNNVIRTEDDYSNALSNLKIDKNRVLKKINDIQEYLEIGYFFSGLKITRCPHCKSDIRADSDNMSCCLCHNDILIKDVENKQIYEQSLAELEVDKNNILSSISQLQIDLNKVHDKKSELERELKDIELYISKLNEEDVIGIYNSSISEYKALNLEENIRKKQMLIYNKIDLELKYEFVDNTKEEILFNTKNMINDLINIITDLRHNKNKEIINKFRKMILDEVILLGMKSVNEVNIDKHLKLGFIQNNQKTYIKDMSEGEKLRIRIAIYIALMRLDIDLKISNHTRILIIDSPNKEEGDSTYINGLKAFVKSLSERYQDEMQIIIGTATREFIGLVDNELVKEKGEFLF